MLKLLGASLVLLAATLAGFAQARQYADRPRQIRGLIAALQRLETEIRYGYTPLPEAMRRIAQQCREPLRGFFSRAASEMNPPRSASAQEGLELAMEALWKTTAMKAPEREVLRQLGCTLGTSDRADQTSHIAMALRQLGQEEISAREDQSKYEKMCRSLGLLLGALIVILIF
ncbi:stage III sporulation protein AB [Paenibacillus spiritus]|uniref:Stage III sporulation protein AB n=1 Tax=Paenibacillus spiritus TaxID=2496557 RepID=A0A5J5GIH0_9BACL|nr:MULTISPECIES: stage III sporulation protein SpoIIIAB [Paenibacillus]KAA9007488.1 stage III sporulation protein AB [Paenibacillus spiritus]